jgi:hypothetical protein
MKKMQSEGCVVKGSPDGGKLGWRLPGYAGPPAPRPQALYPKRAEALELVKAQGFVRASQAPKGLLVRMVDEGLLEAVFKGLYVLPGTVPRIGVLLRSNSLAGRIRASILRNVELYGRTCHAEVVIEHDTDNLNVGSAAVRLRELGVIDHPARGLTMFTALGLRMLAEERRFNPEPGVFSQLGSVSDL